jgi:hypothetical protein
MDRALDELLTQLHDNLDRLADDLMRDRPDLANALRVQSAWIPHPRSRRRNRWRPRSARHVCSSLRPLLYRALDEGVLDERRFDTLMVQQRRAARTLEGAR